MRLQTQKVPRVSTFGWVRKEDATPLAVEEGRSCLEREGRVHNHRERVTGELEYERLARSGDQRNVARLERDLWQALEAPKKSL